METIPIPPVALLFWLAGLGGVFDVYTYSTLLFFFFSIFSCSLLYSTGVRGMEHIQFSRYYAAERLLVRLIDRFIEVGW